MAGVPRARTAAEAARQDAATVREFISGYQSKQLKDAAAVMGPAIAAYAVTKRIVSNRRGKR